MNLPLALWGALPVYEPREPDLSIRVRSGVYEPTPLPDRVYSARSREAGFARRKHDLRGRVYDRLTVRERDERRLRGYWICDCVCGHVVSRTSDNLALPGKHACGPDCPGAPGSKAR